MAAVAELASDVGPALLAKLWVCCASYYRDGVRLLLPRERVAAFAGSGLRPAEQDAVLARLHETFPGSFSSRCLCDVAR